MLGLEHLFDRGALACGHLREVTEERERQIIFEAPVLLSD
jgi:hypothetical protein